MESLSRHPATVMLFLPSTLPQLIGSRTSHRSSAAAVEPGIDNATTTATAAVCWINVAELYLQRHQKLHHRRNLQAYAAEIWAYRVARQEFETLLIPWELALESLSRRPATATQTILLPLSDLRQLIGLRTCHKPLSTLASTPPSAQLLAPVGSVGNGTTPALCFPSVTKGSTIVEISGQDRKNPSCGDLGGSELRTGL